MKIGYLVHTEYHLLLAFQIASTLNSGEEISNIILCTKFPNRFNNVEFGKTGNVEVRAIGAPVGRQDVAAILAEDFSRFHYYLNGDIVNRYLTWKLDEKGCDIYLVQDGMSAYCYNKSNIKPLLIARDTFSDMRELKRRGFNAGKFFVTNRYRYGYNPSINKILLTNPEMFDRKLRKNDKEIVAIPAIGDKAAALVNYFFKDFELEVKKGVVLIINQPLWTDELIDLDIDYVKSLISKFEGRPVYVKLHPAILPGHLEKYRQLEGLEIITSPIPAELIIQGLSDSIIISGYSAALMHNNPLNKYFYYYPVYRKVNDKAFKNKEIVSAGHIQVVNSVEEVSFGRL